MTKETRIGLVVGLLFIIMFGLVLSGLTNSGTEIPTAVSPAPTAANADSDDVRSIVYTPPMSEGRPVVVPAPPEAATAGGVPPSDGTLQVAFVRNENEPIPVSTTMVREPSAPAAGTEVVSHTGGGVQTRTIGEIGYEFRPDAGNTQERVVLPPAPVVDANINIYEVKQGDTLYKIAKTHYGAAYAAKHTLIHEANKDKLTGRGGLRIGMKLVIPPLPAASPSAVSETPRPTTMPAPRHNTPRTDVAVAPVDGATLLRALEGAPSGGASAPERPASRRVYVVRSGDTLYKIAKANGSTIDKIAKANGIKDARGLKIGTKIEIPG